MKTETTETSQPKTASPAQIAANRRNAQKSTGPRTARGCARSQKNALKYGLFAKELLVQGRHARESSRRFRSLQTHFRDQLRPVGPLEDMLVDQIIAAHWRLRRAWKAESGEITVSAETAHWQQSRHNPLAVIAEWADIRDSAINLRDLSQGNSVMETQLRAVRAAVEREGRLTEAMIQTVRFAGHPYGPTRQLQTLRAQGEAYFQANPRQLPAPELLAQLKQQTLAWLDEKIANLVWQHTECLQHEIHETSGRLAAATLPEAGVLDKIMRYETMLERQLYRAMNQLERLQRLREGQSVPPPLTLEVNGRP